MSKGEGRKNESGPISEVNENELKHKDICLNEGKKTKQNCGENNMGSSEKSSERKWSGNFYYYSEY